MKTQYKNLITGICALVAVTACAQDKKASKDSSPKATAAEIKEERTPGNFTAIKVSGAYEVYLKQGESNSVKIVAEKEEDIKTTVTSIKNGVLEVSPKENEKGKKECNSRKVKVYISFQSIERLDVSGACDVTGENAITATTFTIESSGAAGIKIELKAEDVKANVSGAGSVNLSGIANSINAMVTGAGSLKAAGLLTDKATANVSGAGNAMVHAKTTLVADVSGAGSVIYRGEPQNKEVNKSGAGSVRQANS